MKSRIVAISISLLLFFSSLCIIGFAENEVEVDVTVTTETTETTESTLPSQTTTEKPVSETIICSFKDISYGPNKNHTLDLTLPVDNREETGLLLFLHGGGWIGGDKDFSQEKFGLLKENKNYAVASINYRFAELGKTDIYDIVNDISSALSHIKSLAAGYSVNINKVVFYGHSAGGHLSLLYTYRYKSISPITPVGVIATAPAVDLSLDDFYKSNNLGDEKYMCELMSKACGEKFTPETRSEFNELLNELSPTDYVTADCVPTIIVHGKQDKVAPFKGSENLSDLLTACSVNHELIVMENSGHRLDKDKETKEYAKTAMQACIDNWLNVKSN